jgi:hypothetical protein
MKKILLSEQTESWVGEISDPILRNAMDAKCSQSITRERMRIEVKHPITGQLVVQFPDGKEDDFVRFGYITSRKGKNPNEYLIDYFYNDTNDGRMKPIETSTWFCPNLNTKSNIENQLKTLNFHPQNQKPATGSYTLVDIYQDSQKNPDAYRTISGLINEINKLANFVTPLMMWKPSGLVTPYRNLTSDQQRVLGDYAKDGYTPENCPTAGLESTVSSVNLRLYFPDIFDPTTKIYKVCKPISEVKINKKECGVIYDTYYNEYKKWERSGRMSDIDNKLVSTYRPLVIACNAQVSQNMPLRKKKINTIKEFPSNSPFSLTKEKVYDRFQQEKQLQNVVREGLMRLKKLKNR